MPEAQCSCGSQVQIMDEQLHWWKHMSLTPDLSHSKVVKQFFYLRETNPVNTLSVYFLKNEAELIFAHSS